MYFVIVTTMAQSIPPHTESIIAKSRGYLDINERFVKSKIPYEIKPNKNPYIKEVCNQLLLSIFGYTNTNKPIGINI